MKTKIFFIISVLFILLISCEQQETEDILNIPDKDIPSKAELPDGYFEVNFVTSANDGQTKAAISGYDTRVQHIKYVIYKSTGEYVKEKTILVPSQGTPLWPLAVVKDTLPKGNYRVVFLGNIEKTFFPYATSSSSQNYADVLVDYQNTYSNGRIILPLAEFSNNTEYYWANTTFSDTAPNPSILLQRIIGAVKLERVFIDGQDALNMLVNNIVTQIGYKNIIQTTVQAILPGLLRGVIDPLVIIPIDDLINSLVAALVQPLTDALYEQFLQQLVNQIGIALLGNSDKTALIEYLGVLLNPWNNLNAANAVVSINDYPKSIDFDLNVKEFYTGVHTFKYGFNTESINQNRYINLKNFNAVYDVRKINVVGTGLITGVVVDEIIDGFLLQGAFVDINDPIQITNEKTNRRYQALYSILSLGLEDYTQQTDGNHSLTLSVKIGDIANIDDILGGLLGALVGLLLTPLKNITVSVPVNLPLLGIDNLTVSGSWGTVTAY
ncbi:FimB/Mfa2 family fimbrial subunit [Dysgonomonas sp. Marseille-P4677]|uniref:FimB/Mfa2 family fimbrial subunit n=1 Tax=Dysgonomonas sp. Marseille-P4677 TaxID=2364790 RepID=UPI0019132F06|nr:FimB/Mfa2 family fimbrial subunit [Dysgonomonas sp. Marseille-P4677]MBK5722939.1 FimB/Mfa2 family fimbrial subunit [Dysgonomonas sp. Marseille-P4677]